MASWLLWTVYDRLRSRWRALAVALGPVLIVGVLAATTLWAYAFTRLYTRPVSRVQASEWIYEHVPKGAVVANEHWDDPLPLRLPDYPDPWSAQGQNYRGLTLTLYDPDNEQKREKLLDQLTPNGLHLPVEQPPLRLDSAYVPALPDDERLLSRAVLR